MPIPDLDTAGYLPRGIHDCSMAEVKDRFGTFQRSDTRPRIFDCFERYVRDLRTSGLVKAVLIDGSFVTGKDEPGDIDLIIILHRDHDYTSTLRPFEYNALSRRRVRRSYGFDLLVAEEGQPECDEYVKFYSRVKGKEGRTKGLLKVCL